MNQDDFKAGAEWAMRAPGSNLLDPAARVATIAYIKRDKPRRVRVRPCVRRREPQRTERG